MKRCDVNITNLTCHDLLMEIMQILFIYNMYVSCIDILHWKHIWHMNLLEDVQSMWHLFIHSSYFIYLYVKHVFTHDVCV
jgi:hypothetical protein